MYELITGNMLSLTSRTGRNWRIRDSSGLSCLMRTSEHWIAKVRPGPELCVLNRQPFVVARHLPFTGYFFSDRSSRKVLGLTPTEVHMGYESASQCGQTIFSLLCYHAVYVPFTLAKIAMTTMYL
jgi:hypothetical protein